MAKRTLPAFDTVSIPSKAGRALQGYPLITHFAGRLEGAIFQTPPPPH